MQFCQSVFRSCCVLWHRHPFSAREVQHAVRLQPFASRRPTACALRPPCARAAERQPCSQLLGAATRHTASTDKRGFLSQQLSIFPLTHKKERKNNNNNTYMWSSARCGFRLRAPRCAHRETLSVTKVTHSAIAYRSYLCVCVDTIPG